MTALARAGSSTLDERVTELDVSSSRGGRALICVFVRVAWWQPCSLWKEWASSGRDVWSLVPGLSRHLLGLCCWCHRLLTSWLSGPGGPGAWLCQCCEAHECLEPHWQHVWLYGQLVFWHPKEQLYHRQRRLP